MQGAESSELKANIYVNPLGLLQFGPMIGVEIPGGPTGYFDLHVRLQGLGALTYITNDDEDTKVTQFGIGGGYRAFLGRPGLQNQYYAGGIVEFVYSPYGTDNYEGAEYGAVAAGQFGHRWRYESGFFLNVGGIVGAYYPASSEWYYFSDPSVKFEGSTDLVTVVMAELSLGWVL